MKQKVYFRADADQNIGYGHFIRTFALADMLKDDFDCVFYTQEPTEYQKKELSKVCPYVALPSDDSKFNLFLNTLRGDEIVVLDNYFFTFEYELGIRGKGCKVVLIDNLHTRHTCADAVIGFLTGLEKASYSIEPYTKLYLGTNYTLLRRPFLEKLNQKHRTITDNKRLNVVVSFGGSDKYGIAVSIANLLTGSARVNKITIIGDNSNGLIQNDRIIFRSGLTAEEMSEAFASNDVAILPASTTMLEAIACGIKIIGGYFVDNQLNNYHRYVKANAIIGCGDLALNVNQLKVREIIESGAFLNYQYSNLIIPDNIKNNILSIFHSLKTN